VFGFPFFTTWAMQQVPANHGAVVLALLPLATALAATIVAHERPSLQFWGWAVLGAALAVGFALREGGGSWQVADLALLAAILSAAGGYALGAEVSRKLGGWQTISWALVISLPVNLLVAGLYWPANIREAASLAWSGFLYVACISMYLGFFPWYRALALGGIARVGQVQLLQPFMTFAGAALWMGESLDARTLGFALIIAGVVALGRRAPVARRNHAD
jgi:drug/metabolite transporter (DMT)-like permease